MAVPVCSKTDSVLTKDECTSDAVCASVIKYLIKGKKILHSSSERGVRKM